MERLNCFQKTLCTILKNGEIPKHVGFIMDGNRRHAKKLNLTSPLKGHVQGVRSLKKCLLVCRQLGVQMVTLYCFSIQNFKRSEQEVEGLMKLFIQTFNQCSKLTEYLVTQNIRVNIIGNIGLFRKDIQQCISKIEQKTSSYNKMVINLCFGYDSIWQSQESISQMKQGTYKSYIQNLKIPKYLDVLVRTANEKRLSNFMLAQTAYCYICILKQHWPEINIFSYLRILLQYNYNYKQISRQKLIVYRLLENQNIQQKLPQQESLFDEEVQLMTNNSSKKQF